MDGLNPKQIGDFFGRQRRAYWHSVLLAFLFVLAIALTIFVTNLVVGLVLGSIFPQGSLLIHQLTPWVVGLMLLLLIGGTWLEWYRLRDGGRAIARRLGARRINQTATVYEERQLLRAIDNMAVASGMRAPVAYVLDDEPAINAFVAGYQANDMVLVMTWGALQTLDAEELQGIIGHEFSHIHNGDTRLNLRLMSVLGGLLLISQMGSWLLQFGQPALHQQQRGSFLWTGLGRLIWLIGSLGVFMGRFIKLAILRQREFMADAGSVQFTRSHGVLRALLRIRVHEHGSALQGIHAESISHFCFGSALMLDGWFSTHPPLDERIGALDDRSLRRVQVRDRMESRVSATTPVGAYPALITTAEDRSLDWQPPTPLPELRQLPVEPRLDHHLEPLPPLDRMHYVRPDSLKRALGTGAGCRELLAAIMAVRQTIDCDPEALTVSRALVHGLNELDSRLHLVVFYEALLGLGDLPESASRQLLRRLALIIQSDGHISLADILLLEWLKATLHLQAESLPVSLNDCTAEIRVLVEALIYMQRLPVEQQSIVRERILQTLFDPATVASMLSTAISGPIDLGGVLGRLAGLPQANRLSVLAVAETCLWANTRMSQEEADVLNMLHWRLGLSDHVLSGIDPEALKGMIIEPYADMSGVDG